MVWHVWGRGGAHTGFWWGNVRERDHMEDPGVDGRIILRRIFRKCDGGMDMIVMAQDRDRWRTFVNAVMNLQVSYNAGNFLTTREPVSLSGETLLHGERKKETNKQTKIYISRGCSKVHNEELCSLYYSQGFIRVCIKSGTFVHKAQEETVNVFDNDVTSVVTKLNIHTAS